MALQLCDARAKKSSPFSNACFARMRGRDKGRSLLRCLHVTSSSKSQVDIKKECEELSPAFLAR